MNREELKKEITEMSTADIAKDCDQIAMRMEVAKFIIEKCFGNSSPTQAEVFQMYSEMRAEETIRALGALAGQSMKSRLPGMSGFGGGFGPIDN